MTHLVRNLALACFAVAGLLMSHTAGANAAGGAIVSLLAGAAVGLLFSHWDEVDFLLRAPELATAAV